MALEREIVFQDDLHKTVVGALELVLDAESSDLGSGPKPRMGACTLLGRIASVERQQRAARTQGGSRGRVPRHVIREGTPSSKNV